MLRLNPRLPLTTISIDPEQMLTLKDVVHITPLSTFLPTAKILFCAPNHTVCLEANQKNQFSSTRIKMGQNLLQSSDFYSQSKGKRDHRRTDWPLEMMVRSVSFQPRHASLGMCILTFLIT